MDSETLQVQTVQADLHALQKKYDSRRENLQNLEKQVSSLMEIFEIARDFSECISFEAMADLLNKKIMPELPFQRMRFVVVNTVEGKVEYSRLYEITSEKGGKCPLSFRKRRRKF